MPKTKYPSYKPTNIDWIGEIPENWGKWKIAHMFAVDRWRVIDKTQISTKEKDKQIFPVFSSQTKDNWCLGYIETYDYDKDSITWTTDWANAGSVFFRQGKFNATNICGILTLLNPEQSYEYLTYCIRVAWLNNRRVDILWYKLMSNEMSNIKIPLPPLSEQKSIATYLDRKTTLIDEAITTKQKQIKLLSEKRTALINHIVTKGLDPDVEMVDSGVEWIGEIPKGWEVKKLKRLSSKIWSWVTPRWGANTYLDSGIPLLRSQNIYKEWLRLEDVAYISREVHSEMSNSQTKSGDVLINITWASIGRSSYIPNNLGEANVNQHVCIIRPEEKRINTRFLNQFLISNYWQLQVDLCQSWANREWLNFQQLKWFGIVVPPLEEQQTIVDYLDRETNKIDQTITTVQKSIELLKEYKQSLISSVVTGKVKVF